MLNTIFSKFEVAQKSIKKFAKVNAENISRFMVATKMASVFAIILVMPLVTPTNKTYQTRIQFNDKSEIPITLESKEINVIAIPSRDEVKDASFGLNPEALKALMQEISKEYEVDWKMVYAIGYYESGNYSSHLARTQFNFFGRKASSSAWASWSDPEEAIRNQFDYLQTRYYDRGLDTPAEIGPIYCEGNTWAGKITSVMNQL